MTYLDQSEIAANSSMYARVAQCATQQNVDDPEGGREETRRVWASAPGWDDAWASAKAAHENDPADEPVYDPGADNGVITDEMILSQVQATMPQPEATVP